jgi:hypothetical protein
MAISGRMRPGVCFVHANGDLGWRAVPRGADVHEPTDCLEAFGVSLIRDLIGAPFRVASSQIELPIPGPHDDSCRLPGDCADGVGRRGRVVFERRGLQRLFVDLRVGPSPGQQQTCCQGPDRVGALACVPVAAACHHHPVSYEPDRGPCRRRAGDEARLAFPALRAQARYQPFE